MENNKSIMARANLDVSNLTKEQLLILPFYDTYVAMYPNVDTTTAFRVAMNFAYELAKECNQYYHDTPILREEHEALLQYRLVLVETIAKVLRKAMSILGIALPERM